LSVANFLVASEQQKTPCPASIFLDAEFCGTFAHIEDLPEG
jgi:hypothetical protein